MIMKNDLTIPDMPDIPGLKLRRFKAKHDPQRIAELINACKQKDGIERSATAESVDRMIRHLDNCDTVNDMVCVEANGDLIAFGYTHWEILNDDTHLYHINGWLKPAWRGKGIGTALYQAAERRIHEIAQDHSKAHPKCMQIESFETEKDLIALLVQHQWKTVRYETYMTRDLNDTIQEIPLPIGFEIRPVAKEHIRPIFDASNEAFRDHWGAYVQSEEEYRYQIEDPDFRPELWRVAWHGDEIASIIHNFYDEQENIEYNRKRGYTEGICTLPKWRKRGLAGALLSQSMQMFKEMGFTQTALSVDTENISGALGLYERVGYRKEKIQIVYRKPIM